MPLVGSIISAKKDQILPGLTISPKDVEADLTLRECTCHDGGSSFSSRKRKFVSFFMNVRLDEVEFALVEEKSKSWWRMEEIIPKMTHHSAEYKRN